MAMLTKKFCRVWENACAIDIAVCRPPGLRRPAAARVFGRGAFKEAFVLEFSQEPAHGRAAGPQPLPNQGRRERNG
jgi:hypothetical protein